MLHANADALCTAINRDFLSKRKAVFLQPRMNALKLFRPPYGARFERLLKLVSR
jgi:hypothetical protein